MEENRKTGPSDEPTPGAVPGYPLLQIAKALATAEHHDDPETRARARRKVDRWTRVFTGLLGGALKAGSRTPIADVPAWATPEVVTGGFVTGALLAGGPLRAHERALLDELPELAGVPEEEARHALNAFFVTDRGLDRLRDMLRTGRYRIEVPEEGALLVVAWLAQHGHAAGARELLEELAPWFPKLRFYPVPHGQPLLAGNQVHVRSVGETAARLVRMRPNRRILAQKEAVEVWAPLYDRMVDLLLETVEGPVPTLRTGPDGTWERAADGRFPVEGGWPCRRYPEGWADRALQAVAAFDRQRAVHTLSGKPARAKDSLAQVRAYLERCATDPQGLSGRDVGRIRLLLARYVATRGTPGSARWREARRKQAMQVRKPTHRAIGRIVAARLDAYPSDGGLDDVDAVTHPVTDEEAATWEVEPGTPVPPSLRRKVEGARRDTVDALVARGVITSGETLARVLPQVTAEIRASGLAHPALRHLYAALYRAFRRRRSLLLLNLERQVQLDELPWAAAVEGLRDEGLTARDSARQTLEEVTVLALASFPHALLPNKLLQELRGLAKAARLHLPLVDELAADIFMGRFSPKFSDAARRAGDLLEGTLYAVYYNIDFAQVRALPPPHYPVRPWARTPRPTPTDPGFAALCETRAGVRFRAWHPATSGMIIEQQQILTTQNLAVLVAGLDLHRGSRIEWEELARRCFRWVCWRLTESVDAWHVRLIHIKNAAYAWRQMVFFLALLPEEQVGAFLDWADAHLAEQPDDFAARFGQALRGLRVAAEGRSPDSLLARASGARRFLGWSNRTHWLSADPG